MWSVGETLGVLDEESPCSLLCSWDLSEMGDNTVNLLEDKMLDRWVLSSRIGRLEAGKLKLELLLVLIEHPAPLSDELTKLWTLPPEFELLTDSMLDIAEEQDSLSALKFNGNLLFECIFRPNRGALGLGLDMFGLVCLFRITWSLDSERILRLCGVLSVLLESSWLESTKLSLCFNGKANFIFITVILKRFQG